VYEKRTESPLLGNGRSSRSVVDLFSRLLNELGQLVDQKLALFRAELRDQFATAARNAALFAIGGVAAGLGFVYLGFALAFWLGELAGARPAVIVSDSFGRPWRDGITDVAIGAAGIEVLADLRGTPDADGRELHATVVAVADELAAAAELAAGKSSRRPVVLVRGYRYARPVGEDRGARPLVMDRARDLFP